MNVLWFVIGFVSFPVVLWVAIRFSGFWADLTSDRIKWAVLGHAAPEFSPPSGRFGRPARVWRHQEQDRFRPALVVRLPFKRILGVHWREWMGWFVKGRWGA